MRQNFFREVKFKPGAVVVAGVKNCPVFVNMFEAIPNILQAETMVLPIVR